MFCGSRPISDVVMRFQSKGRPHHLPNLREFVNLTTLSTFIFLAALGASFSLAFIIEVNFSCFPDPFLSGLIKLDWLDRAEIPSHSFLRI